GPCLDGRIGTAGGQMRSVRRETERSNALKMDRWRALERRACAPRPHIPEGHGCIAVGGDKRLAVRRDPQSQETALSLQGVPFLSGRERVDVDHGRTLGISTGEPVASRREFEDPLTRTEGAFKP